MELEDLLDDYSPLHHIHSIPEGQHDMGASRIHAQQVRDAFWAKVADIVREAVREAISEDVTDETLEWATLPVELNHLEAMGICMSLTAEQQRDGLSQPQIDALDKIQERLGEDS